MGSPEAFRPVASRISPPLAVQSMFFAVWSGHLPDLEISEQLQAPPRAGRPIWDPPISDRTAWEGTVAKPVVFAHRGMTYLDLEVGLGRVGPRAEFLGPCADFSRHHASMASQGHSWRPSLQLVLITTSTPSSPASDSFLPPPPCLSPHFLSYPSSFSSIFFSFIFQYLRLS